MGAVGKTVGAILIVVGVIEIIVGISIVASGAVEGGFLFAALLASPGILLIVIGSILIGKSGKKKPAGYGSSGQEQWRRNGR